MMLASILPSYKGRLSRRKGWSIGHIVKYILYIKYNTEGYPEKVPRSIYLVLLIFYLPPYTHETSTHNSLTNLRSADKHRLVIFRCCLSRHCAMSSAAAMLSHVIVLLCSRFFVR